MTKKAAAEEQSSDTGDTKKCFVIMPISDVEGYPSGHFSEVYSELIEPAVIRAGYKCELATTTSSAHMIQLDVVTKVATADLCICDLSTSNPNVLFEYGIRQAFDKPTVLIKDDKTRRIFDLSVFRDIEYDHTLRIANTLASRESIITAINDTVGGAKDGEQVFSLVKLMQLTKAALPTGDVDQQDARFTLLEKQLDGLANLITNSATRRIPKNPVHLMSFVDLNGDRFDVKLRHDEVTVYDLQTKKSNIFRSLMAIEQSSFHQQLSSAQQSALRQMIDRQSPNLDFF